MRTHRTITSALALLAPILFAGQTLAQGHGDSSGSKHGGEHKQGGEHKHGGDHKHGGGHHRFENAEAWAKHFESPERDKWQKPDTVLAKLKLKPDSRIADIGSATGYFAVRLARQVPAGRVWGVDIEADMVRYLNQRAQKEKLKNLYSVLGTPSDPLLPEAVDRVLIVDTYHHIGKRVAYFAQLKKRLRPGARIVIVDFKKGELPVGPPDAMKLAPARVESELVEAGFRQVSLDTDALPYQYIGIFEPRS